MVLVCYMISQDQMTKGDATLKVGTHQVELSFCQVCSHRHSGWECIMIFGLSRDLARPRDQSVK